MFLLSKNWWIFLLRGIFALIFGVVAVFYPASAFLALVLIFGAFALVDGILTLIAAFTSNAKSENWWWLILSGILGIIVGILTLIQPAAMAGALVLIIGVWALINGVFQIITAIRIRKLITGEFWLILSGLFAAIFGILVLTNPFAGVFAMGLLIGIYAIIFGITLIGLSLSLRKAKDMATGSAN
jgi:uncharacterized membrane protein HdeD (DUF308 family)